MTKAKPAHNCISVQRHAIMKEDSSIVGIMFDLSTIVSMNHESEMMTGTRIVIRRKKVNRKGEKVIKEERTFVTHNYCPWCGKKYKQA